MSEDTYIIYKLPKNVNTVVYHGHRNDGLARPRLSARKRFHRLLPVRHLPTGTAINDGLSKKYA